jgi:NDP-sugar pyrophosphorylase family protein
MKRKLSITLDRTLLKEAESLIDGISIRNTSQAIEYLLRRSLQDKKTAVILAGGDPKGLLTDGIYRPLMKVGSKTLIEHNIENIRKTFKNIIVVGQNPVIAEIFKVLGDGSLLNVNVNYLEEKEALGTAKTLELAKSMLTSTFLFLPCDHYFELDVGEMLKFHLAQESVVTLSVFNKTNFEWPVAVVEMDGYRVTNYEEHPKKPKTHLRSMLIGIAEPSIFNNIPPGKVEWSLQENVFPKLAEDGLMCGYPVSGNWVNIRSRKDLDLVKRLISQ